MNNTFIRVPLQEKILFTKNLALTLKSGVSLMKGLELLRRQTRNKSLRKVLDVLLKDVEAGMFLSEGLMKFRGVFGDLFVNIIKVAETSGTLPENLIYLGGELEKQHNLRKKVRGALIYPLVILIATIVIATGMVVFVFPKILPLFDNIKGELPFTTRLLIKISDVVANYGIFLLIGSILAIIAFRMVLKFPPIRFVYHQALFFVPILGRSIVNYNLANVTRTLALLLRSGIKIIEALSVTADTIPNLVYKRELRKAAEEVKTGNFISKYFATRPRRFPPIAVNMIEVGENTGNLNENLFYLAEYYENEVDDFVKNLSGLLEPILLLVMGGIVGFIALSFITPIYQLTKGFS